jgi:hypothetical protein
MLIFEMKVSTRLRQGYGGLILAEAKIKKTAPEEAGRKKPRGF